MKKETVWPRTEISELEVLFEEATELAKRDKENRLFGNNHSYSDYFQMRQYQFELLQRILLLIDKIPIDAVIDTEVAFFIEELGEKVYTEDTAVFYLDKLQDLKDKFKQIELPKSYQDFETKSIVFQLLQELEHYLSVKRNLMQPNEKKKKPEKA